MMLLIKKSFLIFIVAILTVGGFSCSNKSYPCPGLGQSESADLSMFDEDGQLKPQFKKKANKKGRIDKSTGMVNKKSPNKIKRQRRTKI